MKNLAPSCPREYRLDAYALAGRPTDHPMNAHLAECAICRSALASFEEATRDFDDRVFPSTFDAVASRAENRISVSRGLARRRVLRIAAAVAPLAAAAAVVFTLLVPRSGPNEQAPSEVDAYVGEKGTVGLEVYVRRENRVFRLRDGDVISQNDALRFVPLVSSKEDIYGMIVSVSAGGVTQAYHPLNGDRAVLLRGSVPLPGSVIMDGTTGSERLFLLISKDPFTLGDVKTAVKKAMDESGGREIPHRIPMDLDQASIEFRKEASP